MTEKEKKEFDRDFINILLIESEKAKKLSEKYGIETSILIVDSIILQWEVIGNYLKDKLAGYFNNNVKYWKAVKTELNKL
jgi:hypothetical protein